MARLSQQELADAVGVARQSISYWENGVQVPTDVNLIALRHALGSKFGSETDAVFSTLQRLHGRSEELEALQRHFTGTTGAGGGRTGCPLSEPFADPCRRHAFAQRFLHRFGHPLADSRVVERRVAQFVE